MAEVILTLIQEMGFPKMMILAAALYMLFVFLLTLVVHFLILPPIAWLLSRRNHFHH